MTKTYFPLVEYTTKYNLLISSGIIGFNSKLNASDFFTMEFAFRLLFNCVLHLTDILKGFYKIQRYALSTRQVEYNKSTTDQIKVHACNHNFHSVSNGMHTLSWMDCLLSQPRVAFLY